jgi:hypothetical protein
VVVWSRGRALRISKSLLILKNNKNNLKEEVNMKKSEKIKWIFFFIFIGIIVFLYTEMTIEGKVTYDYKTVYDDKRFCERSLSEKSNIPDNVVCSEGKCFPRVGYQWKYFFDVDDMEIQKYETNRLKVSPISYEITINGKILEDKNNLNFLPWEDVDINITPFYPFMRYKIYKGKCDNTINIASVIGASGLYIKNIERGCYIIEMFPKSLSGETPRIVPYKYTMRIKVGLLDPSKNFPILF